MFLIKYSAAAVLILTPGLTLAGQMGSEVDIISSEHNGRLIAFEY